MANVSMKYIIIPEYKPLWAMKECFGPTHGPLSRPCKTPVDVIGKLLKQSGKEALTVYEVIPAGKQFSEPVQLTMDNYRLPYEQIVAAMANPDEVTLVAAETVLVEPAAVKEPEVVMPTIVEAPVETEEEAPIDPVEPPVEAVPEESVVETEPEAAVAEYVPDAVADEPKSEEAVEETVVEEEKPVEVDPYAGMTKAERKAARRAEYLARQAAEAAEKADEEPAVVEETASEE